MVRDWPGGGSDEVRLPVHCAQYGGIGRFYIAVVMVVVMRGLKDEVYRAAEGVEELFKGWFLDLDKVLVISEEPRLMSTAW